MTMEKMKWALITRATFTEGRSFRTEWKWNLGAHSLKCRNQKKWEEKKEYKKLKEIRLDDLVLFDCCWT